MLYHVSTHTGSSIDNVKERMQPSADTFLQKPIATEHTMEALQIHKGKLDSACSE